MCHGEPGMMGTRQGKPLVVTVHALDQDRSVHKDLDCIACHTDLAGTETGHVDDPQPADCSICHSEQVAQYRETAHGKASAKGDRLAPTCKECHGTHAIQPQSAPDSPTAPMNIPLMCGRCHREGTPVSETHAMHQQNILENYADSIHGQGLFKKGLTVTAVCTSCHQAHAILRADDPRSTIHRSNVARTCTRCHARIEEVHRKVIEGRLWEEEPHKIPACSECHSPHKVRVSRGTGMSNKDCLVCHGKKDLAMVRDGVLSSLFVDEQAFIAGSHGEKACAQCHTGVTLSRQRPCATITAKVDCSVCHAEIVRIWESSTHGKLKREGVQDAPACLDCHDAHFTRSKHLPSSPTFPRNVPELCARCHREGEKAARRMGERGSELVKSYQMSIHGVKLLEGGLVVTASCADCHTAHGELPAADPRSTVNRQNVSQTCGRCHKGIEEQFRGSIHTTAALKPGQKLPTCEDCHTSHSIKRTDRSDFRLEIMNQCGECHRHESETFFSTFHGKTSQLGNALAAKCHDCHGTHDILPASDTRSHLSRANVVKTCAKCHPGSNRRFAGYLTHATHHNRHKYPFLFYTFWGMTLLLTGTLGFFTLHTLAWLWRLVRTRELWKHHKLAAERGPLVRRFTAFHRSLHLVMLLSFFTLALTGMALKFSYTGWARKMADLSGGPAAMGVLHRIAAAALIGVFLVHLWDLRRMKKAGGLSWFRFLVQPDTLMFNLQDLKEFWGSWKWFLGLGPRPHYGRFTYWEKFDYFAVFWGVFVIGSTGFMLWFPEFFTRLLPGWMVNVATIIHSDEALLAVGFIFTIHFFNTHFRPDKFPMDPVIFSGGVPVDELKFDKPREYETLAAEGRLESSFVPPPSAAFQRWYKIFGFAALAIGLTLIALIIYGVLVVYR